MCGITGIVNFTGKPVQTADLAAMMERQRHRGPDDSGTFTENGVGLGFVRLSILDLSPAGHQPMMSDDDRYVMVFNGEIYNYIEIRQKLAGHYRFRSQTDSEVLLNAYRHWGADCLHHLNGMFAFAIYDRYARTLFAARDRYGVKPFYYHLSEHGFVFSSEIPPIFEYLRSNNQTLTPDDTAVYNYLLYNRTDVNCDTFVRQIKKLDHGHCLTIRDGKVQFSRWYHLADRLETGWQSPEEYYETFESAIALRMRSDVPVGICLSGGLDSSAVASTLIKGLHQRDFYAFSAVYGEGVAGDEGPFIREYEHQLPNLTYVRPTEQTLWEDFDGLIDCQFEPFGSLSIYSQYKVMKDAARHVTVLMDGQGADEQLAGYMYFFGSFFRQLLSEGKYGQLLHEWRSYYRNHHSLSALAYLAFYMAPRRVQEAATFRKTAYLDSGFFQQQARLSDINTQLFNPKNLREALLQHFASKLEHNLKWKDLNSMYFSLEAREPFLDYRLVEKTLASSTDMIMRDGTTKWVLREALRGKLPEKIRTRHDKIGFENPADEWMRAPIFRQKAQAALASRAFRESGYFNVAECEKRLKLHAEGKINIARDIWKWIEMAHFLNRFDVKMPNRLVPQR